MKRDNCWSEQSPKKSIVPFFLGNPVYHHIIIIIIIIIIVIIIIIITRHLDTLYIVQPYHSVYKNCMYITNTTSLQFRKEMSFQ